MFGFDPMPMAELSSHIRHLPEESALARSLAADQGQLPAATARWVAEMRVAHMLLDITTRVNTKGNQPAPKLSHFLTTSAPPSTPSAPPQKPRTMRDWLSALGPWADGVPPPPDKT